MASTGPGPTPSPPLLKDQPLLSITKNNLVGACLRLRNWPRRPPPLILFSREPMSLLAAPTPIAGRPLTPPMSCSLEMAPAPRHFSIPYSPPVNEIGRAHV